MPLPTAFASSYTDARPPITARPAYNIRNRSSNAVVGVPARRETEIQRRGEKLNKLLRQLGGYPNLGFGWDGYCGVTPSRESVRDTIIFIFKALSWPLPEKALSLPLPEAMIGSDGIAGLFWESGDLYASIDFPGDGTYCYITEGADPQDDEGVPIGEIAPGLLSTLRQISAR